MTERLMRFLAPATSLGYEQLTVAGSSVGLAAIPGNAISCLIQVTAAPIIYRTDSGTPSSTAGIAMAAGDFISGVPPASFRAIRSTGVSAILNVEYS